MKNKGISKIAVFLDGRPGHEKQTLGVVGQLQTKLNCELEKYVVRKPSFFSQCQKWLCYIGLTGKVASYDFTRYDLAIGTGTHTHLPMLLAKKHHQIPVITCMTPATPLIKDFDLIFAPQHDNIGSRDNVFQTIGPPNSNIDKKQHEATKVLILIGGTDPKSHVWDTDKILHYIKALISHDTRQEYILSSSPRTPGIAEEAMAALSKQYTNVSFFRYEETSPGWVEKEYSKCAQVWVTGDSISMVYEALSSGCKVGIIPVQWRSKKSKFLRSESFLKENKLVVNLTSFLAGKDERRQNNSLNEAERCADEIIRRWG